MSDMTQLKSRVMLRPTFQQQWREYDYSQTNEKDIFLKLLHDLCGYIEEPVYRFGRPRLSLSDMLFSSALKVYSGFSLRRFMSDMKFVKEKDYINTVCSYSSISNYMRREDLTPILNHLIGLASQPLTTIEDKFAIDSSGFRTTKFNDYMRKRYEEEREHEWIKLHICCGVKSHIITAVEINMHADTTQFIPLTMQTKENGFVIKEMTADKAYCAGSNYEYISSIGGLPFIPFKSNVTGRSHGRGIIWRKMFRYFQLNRDEFMEHYHARSNVESTFNMIKSKFGDLVRSKDDIAQANELLLKVLCHNIVVLIHESLELGIEPDFIYRR